MLIASRTEVGHVRSRQEDALLVEAEHGLVAVCDGLGGHPAGDLASRTAVASLAESAPDAVGSAEALVEAVLAAHDAVLAAADGHRDRYDMATTVVAAALRTGHATVVHVGDSRAYLLLAGDLRPVTRDHGVGGYLSQALGLDSGIEPELTEVDCPPGSRLLLCTDGLTNMVDDEDIASLLGGGAAADACDALVEAALANGGIDNVTVIVVTF